MLYLKVKEWEELMELGEIIGQQKRKGASLTVRSFMGSRQFKEWRSKLLEMFGYEEE